MKNSKKRVLTALMFLVPLLFGVFGLRREGQPLLDAAFSTVTMFALNYGEPAGNLMVQVARWTAPLATASGIIMLFAPLVRRLRARFNKLRGNSVAVYGDDAVYEQISREGGWHVSRGEEELLPADRYVLFGPEQENLAFYLKYKGELEKRDVVLRCSSLSSQQTAGSRLRLYCMEEVGARLFWRQADMLRQYTESGPSLRIALIGFGRLGEELLLRGLQNNLFSPDQKLSYEIYGDAGDFPALHHQISSIEDSVRFHDANWSTAAAELQGADRILVCEQTEQLTLVQQLLFALNGKTLDVLAAEPENLELVEDQSRLRIFDWKNEALRTANLFDDKTLSRAKAVNLRYAHLYGGVAETAENAEAEWAKLDAFTRQSNISAADYHEVRLQQLAQWGEGPEPESVSPAHLDLLAELEHMRWCRFHYLNNWSYGAPVQGKHKNAAARTHSDLVPFASLTEEEREKDRENVRVLLGIDCK